MTEDEEFEFLFELKDLIKEKLTAKDLRAIAKAADWDKEKIEAAYEIACACAAPIPNLTGFLVAAIKNEYQKPVAKEQSGEPKSKNRFNNFEQREYDYADLEKRLLQVQLPPNDAR